MKFVKKVLEGRCVVPEKPLRIGQRCYTAAKFLCEVNEVFLTLCHPQLYTCSLICVKSIDDTAKTKAALEDSNLWDRSTSLTCYQYWLHSTV